MAPTPGASRVMNAASRGTTADSMKSAFRTFASGMPTLGESPGTRVLKRPELGLRFALSCRPDAPEHGAFLDLRPCGPGLHASLPRGRIEVSMGSKGDWFDNAVLERFHATIKKDLIHRNRGRPRPRPTPPSSSTSRRSITAAATHGSGCSPRRTSRTALS
jgi:hypothetical protein